MSKERQSIASRLREEIEAKKLEVDPGQQDAAARLDDLSARLVEQSQSISHKLRTQLRRLSVQPVETPLRGLYLWGGVGRGKTMLMDWFYDSLPPQLGERTHFYRFMRQIHAELRKIKSRADPLDTVAERLAARVHVLCLDEFFVADIADAMILAGLFDGLFRRGVTLVATSNVEPQELYKDGLQRQRFLPAIDLILSHVDVLNLDGGVDYRLRQLEQAPTYLDSKLPDTEEQLKQLEVGVVGAFARGVREAGVAQFCLLSAVGANPRSRIKYARTMGLKEAAIQAVNFPRLAIFRPGIIVGNAHTPPWVGWLGNLVPGPWGNIEQRDIGEAFVAEIAKNAPETGVAFYDNRGMRSIQSLK